MADQTITIDASTHAAQVVRPPNAPPAPFAPYRNPLLAQPTAQPAPTIALAPNQQGDSTEKMATEQAQFYPLYGVTSFRDLDDLQKAEEATNQAWMLTERFQLMVGNIMADSEIVNKETALTKLMNEFTGRLGQAMKPKERTGLVDKVLSLFGKKDKAVEPADELIAVGEDRSLTAAELSKAAPFQVWQTKDGSYRWFAIYSNQFRDNDHPPEIISEKSHKGFIETVQSGMVDYPELWHWHVPGTAWGKADVLDYVEGFAVAAGFVYPGHELEAKALSEMDDIRVSHGMPSRFIVRNQDDPSIIEFHVTSEISPLPGWAAANPLTEFVVL